MTNFTQIQQLKALTRCTTPQALQLLKQTDNNMTRAEQLFHEQNLAFIQQETDCEHEIAEKFYRMYDFDVDKTIEKADAWVRNDIYNHSIITTRENNTFPKNHISFVKLARCTMCTIFTRFPRYYFFWVWYKYNQYEHALVIFAENEHSQMVRDRELIAKTWVCIPLNAGSELLVDSPDLLGFYHWRHGECNYFSLADVDKLIKNLGNIKVSDPAEKQFYEELKDWLINCKPYAHHLIFEDLLS